METKLLRGRFFQSVVGHSLALSLLFMGHSRDILHLQKDLRLFFRKRIWGLDIGSL